MNAACTPATSSRALPTNSNFKSAAILLAKIGLNMCGYLEEASALRVTAATRPLTKHETRKLKTLTSIVERDEGFFAAFLNHRVGQPSEKESRN